MTPQELEARKKVAALARDLYEKKITYEQFMCWIPETDDEEISELIDLIEHEPKRGGWFGASPQEHDQHMAEIFRLIGTYEAEG